MPPTLSVTRHKLTKNPYIDALLTYVQHRGLTRNDVFVASYPRSGSTWLRFMLYELITGQESSFERVDHTIAGMGHQYEAPSILAGGGRLLQIHEPYRNDYCKAIYLVRDVRDIVVSEFRICRGRGFHTGDFDGFFNQFLAGRTNRYGFWADNVRSWLDAVRQGKAVYLVRHEGLRSDPCTALAEMADFLECPRSHKEIYDVVAHHTIEAMRHKEASSPKFMALSDGTRFVGQGTTGIGLDVLTEAQVMRLLKATQPILSQLDYR